MINKNIIITEYDGISYVDIPSVIGRLKNKGFAIDNIIRNKSILYPGKYIITAYI